MMAWKSLLVVLMVPLLLAACEGEKNTHPQAVQDILTQRITPPGRIPVTVLVKYAFSINSFEKAVEEKFPSLDIIQVGNFTRDRGIVEYARRLEHNDLTDIVMTWPLDVGREYWEDRFLDLSALPCTSRYNTSMLNRIAKGGKLYYLPGPAQVRGILYNKTLFEERGWKVPHDFASFIELCHTIEKSGMRSLVLGFANAEVLDTAFIGYGYASSFSSPADNQWLTDYNLGKGNFGSHFKPALDTFQTMIDEGIWKPGDLEIGYALREAMLFSRQCAMVEDSMLIARMGYLYNGSSDEFALMPFFNPGTPADWARLYMVCYIGLNKDLAKPANKEKYDLVLKLLDYISTPEGQIALAADTGAMYSSLKQVPPPDIPEIALLRSTLAQGRYAVFPELQNAQDALRQGLAGLLSGDLTRAEMTRMVDYQNLNPSWQTDSRILGKASADFSLIETGNFITDTMRIASGSDIALFLDNGKDGRYNGKGVSARFYKGPQTMDDVLRVLPDLKRGEEGTLQVVTMSGKDLIHTLEHAIDVDNNNRGWFYYFSGLRMEYAPAAKAGFRISWVKDEKGKPIDPERLYTIAVMDETVPKQFVLECKKVGIPIATLLANAIRSHEVISPSKDGRFVVRYP